MFPIIALEVGIIESIHLVNNRRYVIVPVVEHFIFPRAPQNAPCFQWELQYSIRPRIEAADSVHWTLPLLVDLEIHESL